MKKLWLHRFSAFLAACTLFLIVFGGLVVSKEAGLSVPDWPLSYGQVNPPMEGGIFYEHGHRLIATTVGFLTILLVIFIRVADERKWLQKLSVVALLAVIAQGVLGGLTVIYLLPRPISISHACLAQLFFSTTVAIALFTSPSWRKGPQIVVDEGKPSLKAIALSVPIFVMVQILLGAAYRHKALDIMAHILGAFVVASLIAYACISIASAYPKHGPLRKTAVSLVWITALQILLGIGAYFTRVASVGSTEPASMMVLFTVAHVGVGALTMATSVLLTIQVYRHVRIPASVPAVQEAIATSQPAAPQPTAAREEVSV
jgi:cytochrome c oxidase assembly protein subunit 15